MKSMIAIACIVLVATLVEARPKRSIIYAGVPVVAAATPVVASVPVVQQSHVVSQTSQVVHHNPTSVVKTETVNAPNHASYSYQQEVSSQPVVHTQTHVASAPAVASVPVASAAVAAPVAHYAAAAYAPVAHTYTYGYPASYYSGYHYSPYSYVIGK